MTDSNPSYYKDSGEYNGKLAEKIMYSAKFDQSYNDPALHHTFEDHFRSGVLIALKYLVEHDLLEMPEDD